MDLIYLLCLIALGYFSGTRVERKHYQSIKRREAAFLQLPVVTGENFLSENGTVDRVQFVCGNAALSTDYFKLIFAGLRNLLGGRLSAYETLVDRARREAILRLKETARGADIILNLRVETSRITDAGSVEVFAYATAVHYKK